MGYTHYWYLNEKAIDITKTNKEMAQVVADQANILAGPMGTGDPELEPDAVFFNGLASNDDDYETFGFVPYKKGHPCGPDEDFSFCKTSHRPYDTVVTACLAIAKENLGDGIEIHSDGTREDWAKGVALASKVLERNVPNPIKEEQQK